MFRLQSEFARFSIRRSLLDAIPSRVFPHPRPSFPVPLPPSLPAPLPPFFRSPVDIAPLLLSYKGRFLVTKETPPPTSGQLRCQVSHLWQILLIMIYISIYIYLPIYLSIYLSTAVHLGSRLPS